MAAHQRAVNVCAEIFVLAQVPRAVARHGNERHERPVAHQQNESNSRDRANICAHAHLAVRGSAPMMRIVRKSKYGKPFKKIPIAKISTLRRTTWIANEPRVTPRAAREA